MHHGHASKVTDVCSSGMWQSNRLFGEHDMVSKHAKEAYNISTITFDWNLERSKETISKNSSILDIACGSAEYSIALAKDKCASLLAVDSSPEAIEIANLNADGLIGFKSQVMDAENLSCPEGSYDIVLMRYALHHFHNPEKALAEAYRALKKNGELHIMDVFSYENPVVDTFFNKIFVLIQPENYRLYPKLIVDDMCCRTGFKAGSLSGKKFPVEVKRWAKVSDNCGQIIELFGSADEEVRGELNLRSNPPGDDILADFNTFYLIARK